MLLKEKFKDAKEFSSYAETVSGLSFDTTKLTDWFSKNQDFFLTYTGVMKQLKPFIIKKN